MFNFDVWVRRKGFKGKPTGKRPILTYRLGERASTPLLLISVKNLDCF